MNTTMLIIYLCSSYLSNYYKYIDKKRNKDEYDAIENDVNHSNVFETKNIYVKNNDSLPYKLLTLQDKLKIRKEHLERVYFCKEYVEQRFEDNNQIEIFGYETETINSGSLYQLYPPEKNNKLIFEFKSHQNEQGSANKEKFLDFKNFIMEFLQKNVGSLNTDSLNRLKKPTKYSYGRFKDKDLKEIKSIPDFIIFSKNSYIFKLVENYSVKLTECDVFFEFKEELIVYLKKFWEANIIGKIGCYSGIKHNVYTYASLLMLYLVFCYEITYSEAIFYIIYNKMTRSISHKTKTSNQRKLASHTKTIKLRFLFKNISIMGKKSD